MSFGLVKPTSGVNDWISLKDLGEHFSTVEKECACGAEEGENWSDRHGIS